MDLNELIVFTAVVREGSFNKAAQKLAMPNSTVSAKIASLESRLGVSLLQRTTRKVHATPSGRDFFEKCERALDELRSAEELVASKQAHAHGVFRVTAPPLLGTVLLPQMIAAYRRQHPGVQLDLLLTDREVDLIGEGVDLALRAGELEDSSLMVRKLGITHFAAFASRGYESRKGLPQHPKDLRAHSCIHFTPLCRDEWSLINDKGAKVRIPLPNQMQTDDLHMAKELALTGVGIALLPVLLCEGKASGRRLKLVLPGWRSESRAVSFVYPSHKVSSVKLQSFLKIAVPMIQQRLKSMIQLKPDQLRSKIDKKNPEESGMNSDLFGT